LESIVGNKSFDFAVRVVKLYRYLTETQKEYILSKQLLRSGTSIGANVSEALQGQSKPDFCAKMNIALKEAAETKYWLKLLTATGYLTDQESQSITSECVEIEKILYNIVRTARKK